MCWPFSTLFTKPLCRRPNITPFADAGGGKVLNEFFFLAGGLNSSFFFVGLVGCELVPALLGGLDGTDPPVFRLACPTSSAELITLNTFGERGTRPALFPRAASVPASAASSRACSIARRSFNCCTLSPLPRTALRSTPQPFFMMRVDFALARFPGIELLAAGCCGVRLGLSVPSCDAESLLLLLELDRGGEEPRVLFGDSKVCAGDDMPTRVLPSI